MKSFYFRLKLYAEEFDKEGHTQLESASQRPEFRLESFQSKIFDLQFLI